ncbi:MAG TPA: DUF4214 domain-containing protein [Noviherbaspirillum sp.]|uniref:DUF4214 domain-containing protein n=1 Tax=Noviherbaspirillum sp. TaxID=1926288 RepID=UPI002B49F187|nr:DUF4214 domain-containing protein [Noviherbaspirillum sp.]HJV84324.1 DUF4214 domain-containing protein [Noviherbaspirillum sp.]
MRYAIGGSFLVALLLAGCGGDSPGDLTSSTLKGQTTSVPQAVTVSDYQPIVQQLYVAYFGRPADPGGLTNFAAQLNTLQASTDIQALNTAYGSNTTVQALVNGFGNSDESKSLYPGDTTTFITSIYWNVLHRAPDTEGLNFWINAVDKGGLTRANASFSIMAGALANKTTQGLADGMLINKRIQAATTFTSALSTPDLVNVYKGDNAAAIARDMLAGISASSDAASIQAAVTQAIALLRQAASAPAASEIPAPPAAATLTMSCPDGANTLCSGNSVVRTENGVALTSSGVQVLGHSTSDLLTPNPTKTGAYGLAASSAGMAEVRLAKDTAGTVSTVALLLKDLGLMWDGKTERPQIIETFQKTQGRVQLGTNGAVTVSALPASTDLSFYNYATAGVAATQGNYANNAYFPRTGNPPRCDASITSCPTTESDGIHFVAGHWQSSDGKNPDATSATRLHEDGDIHAGNGLPNADGSPTYLPGGNGFGVPFPGAKGYRQIFNWGLHYANLATWITQDTVQMADWGATTDEHNKNRRGLMTFGQVSEMASVPQSGTATYSGIVYGWDGSSSATVDPTVFRGIATITVDFATRRVNVAFANAVTYNSTGARIDTPSYVAAAMGGAGTNVANYFTASVNIGAFTGGLSGRFFGPAVTGGTTGTGPEEIGGAFTLRNTATGATMLGGFIARKL